MPNQAYTVSPVITTNERGEEVISDLSVSTGHADQIQRDGQVRNVDFDYYEDDKGQIRHRFSEVELESERQDPSAFDESAYIQAIYEANPELTTAQEWAEHNLPEELLDYYNNAVDSSDLGDLHKAVDWLLEQYANRNENNTQSVETQEDETDSEVEDLSDEEKMILAETVEQLEQQEPQGEYYAEQWQETVDAAEAAGDSTYATVAAATAAFHAGEVSADEAINYCLNNCDLKELSRVYKYING